MSQHFCRWCGQEHKDEHCPRVMAFEFGHVPHPDDAGVIKEVLTRVEFRTPEHDKIIHEAAQEMIAEIRKDLKST